MNNQKKKRPDPAQMCCYLCGHIAGAGDTYETEIGEDEEWPICPECGGTNCGGNSSYAMADSWPEEMLLEIIAMNLA